MKILEDIILKFFLINLKYNIEQSALLIISDKSTKSKLIN